MYIVGYFEGTLNEAFQPLRTFATEEEARSYVQINYFDDVEVQPQNIAIMHERQVIFDGRTIQLH